MRRRRRLRISAAARCCPSGTRRPRARTAGLRGSPRRRATGRGACRRRRRPSAPTSGSRRCRPARCCARRARRRAARAGPSCTGPRKPIASSTRSAFISNSVPGISTIFICPSASFCHSTRAATSFSTLPFLPSKRLVATAQSRSQPSSCDDDVRSLIGQYGQTSGLFSCSGGCGSSSNCVTDFAPLAVRRADAVGAGVAAADHDDVLARRQDLVRHRVAGDDLVLLRQELHREVDAGELAAGHRQVARLLGAAGRARPRRTRRAASAPATSTPTCTPGRNSTPSIDICAMRRSIRCFSILKSGMP